MTLKFLSAQINPLVGAITKNTEKIVNIITTYQHDHDIIIFPELALTGYPPEDLLFRQELVAQIDDALTIIQSHTKNCHIIIGHPSCESKTLYNSASVIFKGKRIALYHKQHLPNYGVFDEQRYFSKGEKNACVFTIKDQKIGLCICEDIWHPGPVEDLLAATINTMICINASPFDIKKYQLREALVRTYAKQGIAVIYVNQIGGQDELLFDGQSFALDNTGKLAARSKAFVESMATITIEANELKGNVTPLPADEALIYQALVCGLKDYVEKNNFPGVLLGLSGGIDSALTLCIAADALGPEKVHAVLMPSRFTAEMSVIDAQLQAEAMGVPYSNLSIEPSFQAILTTLTPAFKNKAPDVTEENLQARIRAIFLMALSNKTGNMLLTTSNKSETAVGYTTLYGDMAGGFAVLKDVLKTSVYELARYRNSLAPVIPERVLTRAPSAELAANQTDQDSLPAYEILDAIITKYMEENLSAEEIIKLGYSADDITKVIKLIKRNEYKRRQAAPGPKITARAFGKDWRYPITSGFEDTSGPMHKK
jgi:NAD+ synthase (glutamine-hydrolysing)